ncbi:carboxyl-terminal processing protease [Granulicatella balaenopterae]|uniref:Carboxyl-terminal processing protease n=1 Tax=Granulicatella balaenopterae TaxID=137733 RepID=A0A1H9K314_9LACT|nr:S41 family peptidase [Granulicatella balaenopterae]SEQ93512.1 carboxyl-terminal processing protease [Granulicatella balaenopterae]
MDKFNKEHTTPQDSKKEVSEELTEGPITTEESQNSKESSYIHMKKSTFNSIIAALIVVIAFMTAFVTVFVDHQVIQKKMTNEAEYSIGLPPKDFKRFEVVYSYLKNGYVDETVTSQQLIDGAIRGMTDSLEDPYTVYLMNEETEAIDETITGSFAGIGSELKNENGMVVISTPIEGTPSQKAGLQPNDVIYKVDGKDVTGWPVSDVVKIVRGEVGTDVTLTIIRQGQELDITITREEIPVITVRGELDQQVPSIGRVTISNFSLNTDQELEKVVSDLRQQGATSFVFDVRYNPGGLLNQALRIANMFLLEQEPIMQIEDRQGKITEYHAEKTKMGDFKITEPYVLLVNKGSASAAEILTGALQESANATIIGTKTYGKGTVQTVIDVTDNSELKYTNAKWLTPNGNWIHKEGITPTIEVALPDYAFLSILDTSVEPQSGDVSANVRNLELMLEAFGYPVVVDGYFDEATTKAVTQYQSSKELDPTGIVDEKTANALMDDIRQLIEQNDTQYKKAVDYLTTKE